MSSISQTSGASSASSGAEALLQKQLQKRATEFEAMMLEQLIGPIQKSFSQIDGEVGDAGEDTISGLATQTLAQGMAEQGGVGFAKMTLQSLRAADSR